MNKIYLMKFFKIFICFIVNKCIMKIFHIIFLFKIIYVLFFKKIYIQNVNKFEINNFFVKIFKLIKIKNNKPIFSL